MDSGARYAGVQTVYPAVDLSPAGRSPSETGKEMVLFLEGTSGSLSYDGCIWLKRGPDLEGWPQVKRVGLLNGLFKYCGIL